MNVPPSCSRTTQFSAGRKSMTYLTARDPVHVQIAAWVAGLLGHGDAVPDMAGVALAGFLFSNLASSFWLSERETTSSRNRSDVFSRAKSDRLTRVLCSGT
jgi:hypothetical protein